jgi:hypothetical protein
MPGRIPNPPSQLSPFSEYLFVFQYSNKKCFSKHFLAIMMIDEYVEERYIYLHIQYIHICDKHSSRRGDLCVIYSERIFAFPGSPSFLPPPSSHFSCFSSSLVNWGVPRNAPWLNVVRAFPRLFLCFPGPFHRTVQRSKHRAHSFLWPYGPDGSLGQATK